MSANLNKVFLIGNLTRDPELRYIPSGQAVTSFTLAVNRVYTDPSGQRKEEANFFRVVAWGKRAEICNEYLKKGSSVFVEGRLQARSWQAQDGSKRTTIEIVVQNIQFLSRAGSRGTKVDAAQPASAPAAKEDMIVDDSFSGGGDFSSEDLTPDDSIPF